MRVGKYYLNSERGLSQEVINQLPVYKYKSPNKHDKVATPTATDAATNPAGTSASASTSENAPKKEDEEESGSKTLCSICMDGYKEEEDIMILPCLHQVILGIAMLNII